MISEICPSISNEEILCLSLFYIHLAHGFGLFVGQTPILRRHLELWEM